MKITLRKANALQTVIQEFIRGIEIKTTAHLNEFEDDEVLELNVRTEIELSDETVAELQQVACCNIYRELEKRHLESLISSSSWFDSGSRNQIQQ